MTFTKGHVYYSNCNTYGIAWECLESTIVAHVRCQAVEFTGNVPDHITVRLFDPQTIVFGLHTDHMKNITEYASKKAWETRNEVKDLLA